MLVAAAVLHGVDGELRVDVVRVHSQFLPSPDPAAGRLVPSLDAGLKVGYGGSLFVGALEVLDESFAHVVPGVDASWWELVDPLLVCPFHHKWEISSGQQITVAGDSRRWVRVRGRTF